MEDWIDVKAATRKMKPYIYRKRCLSACLAPDNAEIIAPRSLNFLPSVVADTGKCTPKPYFLNFNLHFF